MTGPVTWLGGCTGSVTATTDYAVPQVIYLGKGVTGTATAIHGTYSRSINCDGIIQSPLEQGASCEPEQDWTEREEFTVTVDLHRLSSALPWAPRRPVIEGAARPGSTLSVSLPGWTAAERSAARFRWSRCSGPSRCDHGPTTSTYRVKSTDVGSQISVAVASIVNRRPFTLQSALTRRVSASGGGNPPAGR